MSALSLAGEPGVLEVEHVADVVIVHLAASRILDESNVAQISEHLFALVEGEGCRKLLVDFSAVEYLSSAALGALITLDKKLKAATGRMRFCGMDPKIHQVFAVTRLDKIFDIREDRQAALADF